ncbi:hypothetical protein ACFQX7_19445 [Luedemannella flava]
MTPKPSRNGRTWYTRTVLDTIATMKMLIRAPVFGPPGISSPMTLNSATLMTNAPAMMIHGHTRPFCAVSVWMRTTCRARFIGSPPRGDRGWNGS